MSHVSLFNKHNAMIHYYLELLTRIYEISIKLGDWHGI